MSSQKRPPFEQAILAHLDRLFAFALRLEQGQRDRADDLVQEASLQAWRPHMPGSRTASCADPLRVHGEQSIPVHSRRPWFGSSGKAACPTRWEKMPRRIG